MKQVMGVCNHVLNYLNTNRIRIVTRTDNNGDFTKFQQAASHTKVELKVQYDVDLVRHTVTVTCFID
jgi:hypothetical protein